METAYKEILLFNGFEQLDEDELKKFKFLIPEKLQIPKSQLKAAKRTDVAQLMVESVGAETALKEAIKLFKKLKQNETAKNLEKEKKKVDAKYKKVKNEAKSVKKKSQDTKSPGVSAASTSNAVKQPATSKAHPPRKKMKKEDAILFDSNSTVVMKELVPEEQETTNDEMNKCEQKSSVVTKKKKNLQLKSENLSGTKVTKAKKKKSELKATK